MFGGCSVVSKMFSEHDRPQTSELLTTNKLINHPTSIPKNLIPHSAFISTPIEIVIGWVGGNSNVNKCLDKTNMNDYGIWTISKSQSLKLSRKEWKILFKVKSFKIYGMDKTALGDKECSKRYIKGRKTIKVCLYLSLSLIG